MTDNELQISGEDFKLIKSFYPDFIRKHVKSNDFIIGWSELMPVVEKIYRLEDGVTIRGVTFTLKNSRAVIKDGKKTFSCHTISPLNSTYRVVVEFIKWYNNQTK